MNPYYAPELFDSIVLGSHRSPGVVTLSGHDRNPSWDIKEAKGQEGASTSLNGAPIGQFQATFYLVADYEDGTDEFILWESFQRLIESTTKGPTPTALPIYHPDLARNGFTEVSNGGVSGLLHDGRGGATVIVKFVEFKPPRPKPVVKAKPKADVKTPAKPDPNAAAKRELEALLAEAKRP